MKISDFEISENSKVFIIAELSANHNGKLKNAVETIKAAKKTGADAIKIQTYTPDTITMKSDRPEFRISHGTIWDGTTLYELYKTAFTPYEWHPELFKVAKEEGLICFSSPFDPTAVDLLENLNAPAYKIASFEITDIPLIKYVAEKGKPVIMSTGIATEDDIKLAIDACRSVGNDQLALLKCTSAYPAKVSEADLCMIPDFKNRFNVIPGLSDHTLGSLVPTLSVALGAKIIEKHFILDKSIGGPDASFSLDIKEFTQMVDSVREAESALGTVNYQLTKKKKKSRLHSRSLFISKEVSAGDKISRENIRSIRPNNGLHPKYLEEIIGKTFKVSASEGTPLDWSLIE